MRHGFDFWHQLTSAAPLLAMCASTACSSARPAANADATSTHDGGTSGSSSSSSKVTATNDASTSQPPQEAGVVQRPPDPCAGDGGCPTGVWIDVTPASINLTDMLDCGNYGTKTIQVDPGNAQDVYTLFLCQGVWKSSDYGQTWNGPINTGMNGATMGDCAGGVTVTRGSGTSPPNVYASCIRGNGLGFWKSTNGGVDWQIINVAPAGTDQEFYPPEVDPYDPNHLLMAGHAENLLVQSFDGGMTWANVALGQYMNENGGTGGIAFVDTGDAATTRNTWLWLSAPSPPLTNFPPNETSMGTWRTTDGGSTWTYVDMNEHTIGSTQIYQPDTGGVVYMAGIYSGLGWGVLRSTDYGQTWAHVGLTQQETVVFGTPKNVYAMLGGGGPGEAAVDPSLEVAPQPGTGTWTSPGTPMAMTYAPARAAVTNDGKNSVIVVAAYNSGVWRYIEP